VIFGNLEFVKCARSLNYEGLLARLCTIEFKEVK
jgi:hypothetical protein